MSYGSASSTKCRNHWPFLNYPCLGTSYVNISCSHQAQGEEIELLPSFQDEMLGPFKKLKEDPWPGGSVGRKVISYTKMLPVPFPIQALT